MKEFEAFLAGIEDPQHRARTEEVLAFVAEKFPKLQPRIAWNQPMFTDHGTFIVGFSVAKKHLAVGPEIAGVKHFAAAIAAAGYSHTQMLVRFPWEKPVNYMLLEEMIAYNIKDKADCTSFWRK